MGTSIRELTTRIRDNNVTAGWRALDLTIGDRIALLHSEVAEALEAFHDTGVADATEPAIDGALAKPEGFGSELADVVVRLFDTCDIYEVTVYEGDFELGDVSPIDLATVRIPGGGLVSVGDHLAWLHRRIDQVWLHGLHTAPFLLRAVVAVAERYGVDLAAEVERKVAYNATREFQNGGRAL